MSTDPEILTCADVEPLLPLVADEVLDDESDPDLFAHLARCARCQDALARHDLVTLAVSTAPLRAVPPAVTVIRYRVPQRWIAATAALLTVAILGAAWNLRPHVSTDSVVAVQELIRIADPETGRERPMLLIRQGDRSTLVDPREFDHLRGEMPQHDPRAVPVRQRY